MNLSEIPWHTWVGITMVLLSIGILSLGYGVLFGLMMYESHSLKITYKNLELELVQAEKKAVIEAESFIESLPTPELEMSKPKPTEPIFQPSPTPEVEEHYSKMRNLKDLRQEVQQSVSNW